MMNRRLWTSTILLALVVLLSACATVPHTGRKQLNLISDSEMQTMSRAQYSEVLDQSTLSDDQEAVAELRRIGGRIQGAVEQYFKNIGRSYELTGYEWEFNLIESEQINAWAMPGGKVAFYTGILPICEDENGIAVVMGHEIAHAIAEHGNERMSQALLVDFGGMLLSEVVKEKPEETQAQFMMAFGVGTALGVMLPFSRTQESEADYLGLIFMSMAGYDPHHAVTFWQRMARMKQEQGGGAPPEWMSTHPADETRVRKIREHLPEALTYYKPGP
jgi:predicted Zn-dependent protease